MLKTKKRRSKARFVLSASAGNVSQYAVEKLLDFGAKPVTVSDSNSIIYDPDGIDREKSAWVMELKNVKRGRIRDYADKFKKAILTPTDIKLEHNPLWNGRRRLCLPSATQNEITAKIRAGPDRTASSWWPRARTCRPRSKRPRCSSMPGSVRYRPRPPMPAARAVIEAWRSPRTAPG